MTTTDQKHLKISAGLSVVPESAFELAETLEVLDLSGNQLSQLPPDFDRFKKLRILFLSNNSFSEFPKVLGRMRSLDIVGFKANKISFIDEDSIPINLRWLILTDNSIYQLPNSIGECKKLQKVMLAGNQLSQLPNEMAGCSTIELLRISANRFQELPHWLFKLPKLSWLACAGNPCQSSMSQNSSLDNLSWKKLNLKRQLGEGASGFIYEAKLDERKIDVAVKIFKGNVTSDGWPEDEMKACLTAGHHSAIVKSLFQLADHPEGKKGVVFSLIPSDFKNLGLPPDFNTCTRDTFLGTTTFTIAHVRKIALSMASALKHLHERGIMHGDLYAHNILLDTDANALLSDFGAATLYDRKDAKLAASFERLDVRAFGCLLNDLLVRTVDIEDPFFLTLTDLMNACLTDRILERPDFKIICNTLTDFNG